MTLSCTQVPAALAAAFSDSAVCAMLEMIVDAWPAARQRAERLPRKIEVPINRVLKAAITQSPRFRASLFELERELPLDDDTGEETGRIDLRFTSKDVAKGVCLVCECKRLRIPGKRNIDVGADAYVQGMLRFFDRHAYGAGQRHGGMIGYVMDGRRDLALRALQTRIGGTRTALGLRGQPARRPLAPSSFLRGREEAHQSEHLRDQTPLTLHHLLLSW